jgi:hypothetical protein
MAGLFSDLVAWQRDPGVGGAEIRARYADDGATFDPDQVVSTPDFGPTNAVAGLAAAGDVDGNAAIAWVQGSGSATRIVARLLYRSPGSFRARQRLSYAHSHHPRLRWLAAREHWGIRYDVFLDGGFVGETGATSIVVPRSLRDGPHRWYVLASNPAGQHSVSPSARVWVDTVAPRVRVAVRGSRRVGAPLRVHIAYTDVVPPTTAATASGIASVLIRWGDGGVTQLHRGAHSSSHAFSAARVYRVVIVVIDRAGNRTRVLRRVRIRTKGRAGKYRRH